MHMHDLNELNILLVQNLHKIRAIPFDIIVHLPRSGTIPASLLSTYMLRPLASVEEYCRDIIITRKSEFSGTDKILLVDDSIRTGKQMTDAIQQIKRAKPDSTIYTLAIFSTKYKRDFQPTLFLSEHEETEYIYPWFMWKTKRISQCAVDMDGVLCRDCTREEDDDGENYLNFIRRADPKFRTNHVIGAIVTSRLEKYRFDTEKWLSKRGIKYGQLIMGPWPSKEQRRGNSGTWKAGVYSSTAFSLFIESSVKESVVISHFSKKPVWCIDNQKLYT